MTDREKSEIDDAAGDSSRRQSSPPVTPPLPGVSPTPGMPPLPTSVPLSFDPRNGSYAAAPAETSPRGNHAAQDPDENTDPGTRPGRHTPTPGEDRPTFDSFTASGETGDAAGPGAVPFGGAAWPSPPAVPQQPTTDDAASGTDDTASAPQRPAWPDPIMGGPARPSPTPPPPPPGENTGVTDVVGRQSFGPPPFRDDAPPPPPWETRGPQPPTGTGTYPQQYGPPADPRGPQQADPRQQPWNQTPPARPSADPAPRPADPYRPEPGRRNDNYNYVDQIRSSELVPSRKIPPARGWRKWLLRSTFGLINLGQSPDERRQAELEAKIRSLLRGRYKIAVLGKGGTGKSTVAAAVGSIFAELRQEDRVVAIDADTAFGKLGSRVDPNAAGSYWELAADQHLHTFADMRTRVGNNNAGLFVLAGEASTARRRVLDPEIYRAATARLDNHFTISIIDCGSTMDSPVTQTVLNDANALIVVASPWIDGASAAGQTLQWLSDNGHTGLLHRSVVVVNDHDGHVDKSTLKTVTEHFATRGQPVIEVPFDMNLRPGGVVDVDNELNRLTRRRFVEIAAAIAEHFPTTTDAPRDRR
ncbi:chromosome partitioning protein [Mycobacterium sp. 236(2023)]|uniref:MinD/ParA family ATP-binding protein n=1 Tax=Mycobacterium sp. 236(2023) TaxID=3038163 RepID=UPI0024158EBC|nr:chromosome partitioning protein [Mycobacterium sp. 236(2023)]MDG4667955.1 chromosome partitioning protein [Mycobacterium sp. 236(2023)]